MDDLTDGDTIYIKNRESEKKKSPVESGREEKPWTGIYIYIYTVGGVTRDSLS